MKELALLAVCVSLACEAAAPVGAVVPSPRAATADGSCSMECCRGGKTAGHKQHGAAPCRCPVACVVPAQAAAVMPEISELCPPSGRPASWRRIADESAPERNARPPVPPPRV